MAALRLRFVDLLAFVLLALAGPAAAQASTVGLADTWSGTGVAQQDLSNAPNIHVVYAYAADQPDRLGAYGPVIQQELSAASDQMAGQTGGRLVPRWDRQFSVPQYLDTQRVRLPHALSYYKIADSPAAFARIKADLAAVLSAAPGDKFLVFADNTMASAVAGRAESPVDDQPGPANKANYDDSKLAVVFGDGSAWFSQGATDALTGSEVPLHEAIHALGAVQPGAPHYFAQGDGGHVNNPNDLMYPGPTSLHYSNCPLQPYTIDCGGDDYFNAINPTGYLATHWNVAHSFFLGAPSTMGKLDHAPDARLAASAGAMVQGSPVTFDASSSHDDGGVVRYLFDLDGDGKYETDNGASPLLTTALPRLGAYQVSVRAVDAVGAYGVASVQVAVGAPGTAGGGGAVTPQPKPNQAPVPVLRVSDSSVTAGAAVTFSAAGSYDPEGRGISYSWDFDGDGRADSHAETRSYRYTHDGRFKVTLTVADGYGATARASQMVTITKKRASVANRHRKSLSLSRTRTRQKEHTLLRHGLTVRGAALGKGKIRVTIKLGKKTLGTRSIRIKQAGNFSKRIKLTRKGKAALKDKHGTAKVKVSAKLGKHKASKTVRVH